MEPKWFLCHEAFRAAAVMRVDRLQATARGDQHETQGPIGNQGPVSKSTFFKAPGEGEYYIKLKQTKTNHTPQGK